MFRYQNSYLQDGKWPLPLPLFCILIWIIPAVLAGCGNNEPVIIISEFEIELNVSLQNKSLLGAAVFINDIQAGHTDEHGYLSRVFRQKPGTAMNVRVSKAIGGYQIEPWQKTFIVLQPQSEILDKYAFDVELQAEKIISVVVTDDNETPLADAKVRINDAHEFKTDANGMYQHRYISKDSAGLHLNVSKPGYTTWKKQIFDTEPGHRFNVVLVSRSILSVNAYTDTYGLSRAIPGIDVLIEGRRVGQTDEDGMYRHTITGKKRAGLKITLQAAGYLPARWTTTYKPGSDANVLKHFLPDRIKPLKTVHIGYRNNAAGNEVEPILKRLLATVEQDLYRNTIFKKVSIRQFSQAIKSSGLSRQNVLGTGWHSTAMLHTVDMIITGSVSLVDNEWMVITDVHRPDGKIILSTIMRVMGDDQINLAGRGIARSLVDHFPFEGFIVASQAERYRINLDRTGFGIRRGNTFKSILTEFDSTGNISGRRITGRLRVFQADETGTWARIMGEKSTGNPDVGQRVIRQVNPEKAEDRDKALILRVSRGRSSKPGPLGDVHVYMDDQWVGQTGADGKTRIVLKPGEKRNLSLYKHGFQPLTVEFEAEQNKRSVAFSLEKVPS